MNTRWRKVLGDLRAYRMQIILMTMVLVLGTSACHMMNSRVEQLVPGIAGVVEEGILPGYFGYETGQAATPSSVTWITSEERSKYTPTKATPRNVGIVCRRRNISSET